MWRVILEHDLTSDRSMCWVEGEDMFEAIEAARELMRRNREHNRW